MYEGDDYKGWGLRVPKLCLFKSYEPHPIPPGPASMVVLFEPFNKKWRFPNAVRGFSVFYAAEKGRYCWGMGV